MESKGKHDGGKHEGERGRLELAAMGMEAEFSVRVDGAPALPERVFGSPRSFVRGDLMHRQGTSYHLPTGGAVYFDTGVIEVATPVIEIAPGASARAGRSLWESILFLREELDAWERRSRREVRLVGFSTHYNVSFELPEHAQGRHRTVRKLALLLAHVLPAPVMMLATNRRSSGVGVRPRGDRIEITVDFTPSASLMIATGTLIVGIVREVMGWESYGLDMLEREGIPRVRGFRPVPHTSRKGWLAARESWPADPFEAGPDAAVLPTRDGGTLTLRELAGRIAHRFWHPIRRVSDPFTFRLIGSVIGGRVPSLLDLADRPPEYDDVGRLCTWENLFPESVLKRSRYEQVLIHAIRGETLSLGGRRYTPVGMQGWSAVVFRADDDGSRRVIGIDALTRRLGRWR
jgi:hypothetical protein